MAKNDDRFDNGDGEHIRAALSVRLVCTGLASGASADFDLDALATAQGQKAIPAKAKIVGAHMECETALTFSAGTTTGAGFVVGITGTENGLLTTAAVTSMAAREMTDLGGPGTLMGRLRGNTAPSNLVARLTPTGGAADCDEISAGVFWVHLEYTLAKGRRQLDR